jgi:hypothetical protein
MKTSVLAKIATNRLWRKAGTDDFGFDVFGSGFGFNRDFLVLASLRGISSPWLGWRRIARTVPRLPVAAWPLRTAACGRGHVVGFSTVV